MKRHLLSANDLTREDALLVLDTAERLAETTEAAQVKKLPTLRGRTMRPYLDEAASWILDGFPRNRPQADLLNEMLKELGAELDAAVVLEAPDEALIERLSGRRMSEATGKIYHVEYDPPPESSEEDPGPYIQRKDDREESIQHRLEIYHEQTEPLKYYFAEKGILVTVDATQGIPEVTEDILDAVGEKA